MRAVQFFISFCLSIFLVTIGGCDEPSPQKSATKHDEQSTVLQLSREDAKGLIEESQTFREQCKTLVLVSTSSERDGIALDLWDSRGSLTSEGTALFDAVMVGEKASLKTPVSMVVEVTGIVPSLERPTEVQFSWRYENLPVLIKGLAVRGGNGTMIARKYDDGWRLETISFGAASEAASQTPEDTVAIQGRREKIVSQRRDRIARAQRAMQECTELGEGSEIPGLVGVMLGAHHDTKNAKGSNSLQADCYFRARQSYFEI